ncbi:MAG: hypothetical protein P9E88_15110 [Candidatus Competibacter sp.]|jgi:hypothetical protein|nr:hypothetical protein [Candidatus Competibacter sp.]
MTKARTFAAHLAISAFVLMNFAALVYWIWYPSPLLELQGGLKIIGILCCWPMC